MLRITLLVLAALACQAASGQDNTADNYLYNSVIVGDFEAAVSMSYDLVKENDILSIKVTVQTLINENQRNLMDYAYYLWKEGGEDIVKNYFPHEFKDILGLNAVKLTNQRDNMVLKLGDQIPLHPDFITLNGDRVAYGNANHMVDDRMTWIFEPVEDNGVYFQMYNPITEEYLKVGIDKESNGDHGVYGTSYYGTSLHEFYLVPAMYDNHLLFYIVNNQYNQALKLSGEVNSDGDQQVYSELLNAFNDPYTYGWSIEPL